MNIGKINQANFQAHIKLKPSDISKIAIGTGAMTVATTSIGEAGLLTAATNQHSENLTPETTKSAVEFNKEALVSSNTDENPFNREVSSEASSLPVSSGLAGGYTSSGASNAISAVINTDKLEKISAPTELYSNTQKAQLGTALSSILATGALGLYSGNDIINNTEVNDYTEAIEKDNSDLAQLASYASITIPPTILSGTSDLSEAKSFEFIAKTLAGVDTEEENPS